MTSILTNTGAMTALQTLRSVNNSLNDTQSQISTGKKISTAKDNAAVWAISKTMEADVSGFKAISSSLSLGESTVAVARQASETVTDLLTQMKERIIAAQEQNVPAEKLQTDIEALTDQIKSVVGAAQFNGLNLVNGSSEDDVEILASLDRSDAGVTSGTITVERQNLAVEGTATVAVAGTADTTQDIIDTGSIAGDAETVAAGDRNITTIVAVGEGHGYQLTLDDSGGDNLLGAYTTDLYVAKDDDSAEDIAKNLSDQITKHLVEQGITEYTVSRDGDSISIVNNSGDAIDVTGIASTGGTPESGAAGLAALDTMDVETDAGKDAALNTIETLITTAIDASAAFGSVQRRIETQTEFVSGLSDAMKTGIGALVDADMEETSARLQALQTQQQLGVQALSIANQAPQTILSLFR